MFSPRFDLYLHYHVLIVCSCILIYVMKWEGLIVFSLKIICIDYNVTKQIMCSQLNICLVLTVSALSECVQTICDISKEQSSFNFCFFSVLFILLSTGKLVSVQHKTIESVCVWIATLIIVLNGWSRYQTCSIHSPKQVILSNRCLVVWFFLHTFKYSIR